MSQARETPLERHTFILSLQGEENAGYPMLWGSLIPCTEKTDQTRRAWQVVDGKEILLLAQMKPLIFVSLASGIHPSPAGKSVSNTIILKQGKFSLISHSLLDS